MTIKQYLVNAEFTKEYILSIPKIINENGCWISEKKPNTGGYVEIIIDNKRLKLHRVVMCLYYDINYFDSKIDTRHSTYCDRSCFNPEHLKPGSISDNVKDQVRDGIHNNARKECCPKCGSSYRTQKVRRDGKITLGRYCPTCRVMNSRRKKK